jgi:hypothetical protein
MENKNTILQELLSLSPFLAEKRPGHPYEVPANYFAEFPGRIVLEVSGPVVPVSQGMPMDVPAGYFDGLAAAILSKIKETESNLLDHGSELLTSIGKNIPYQVPSSYFEDNLQSLHFVSWNESAPNILTIIGKKNPYTIPEGYFKQVPSRVHNKIKLSQKSAPVYPLSFVKKVYRYAAAAILVGIISVTGLIYFRNHSFTNPVANISTFDINKISIEELQNYITGQELVDTDNDIIATNGDLDAADLKEFLNDMPEEALQQYVQQYADPNTN